MTFTEFREQFFRTYLEWEPEEGTTLGVPTGNHRLRDISEGGLGRRNAFFVRTRDEIVRWETTELPLSERIDAAYLKSVCEHEIHGFIDLQDYQSNVEWSLYPYTMICYQETQGIDATARASQCRKFLEDHTANLRQGLKWGNVAHRSLIAFLVDNQLPAAIDHLAARSPEAAEAYRKHAIFLKEELLPHAGDTFAIGEAEYRWQLENTLGITESPEGLLAEAWDFLEESADKILPAGQLQMIQKETFTRSDEIVPTYRGIIERAVRFVEENALFHIPKPYDLGMDEYPKGMRHQSPGTNWPAPLLDAKKKGQFVVHPDPKMHSKAWATVLALHEAIPGHFLQSLCWQKQFGNDPAPVRFLCVADDVAIPRGFYGAMLNIEGFAVYAEDVMLRAGFYEDDQDRYFAWATHRLRAARVIVDISLHTGRMGEGEAKRFLEQKSGIASSTAANEIERYKRIPLQAITYFLGFRQIARLANEYRALRPRTTDADFHAQLFAEGPVPPAMLRKALLG